MELMLSEALPIYSGGLGNVAGDQLKAASDLGVPVVGCSTSKAIFARRLTRTGRNIRPMRIQVYTLDREPADKRIEKVSLATLQWIANRARWRAGVQADIF